MDQCKVFDVTHYGFQQSQANIVRGSCVCRIGKTTGLAGHRVYGGAHDDPIGDHVLAAGLQSHEVLNVVFEILFFYICQSCLPLFVSVAEDIVDHRHETRNFLAGCAPKAAMTNTFGQYPVVMTDDDTSAETSAVDRVLQRATGAEERGSRVTVFGRNAQALNTDAEAGNAGFAGNTTGDFDLEARSSLKRVAGLRTELEDVTEVEYRELRLENVVLVGVHQGGQQADAENSMHELAALCETAGATVLDGILQKRPYPDPATFLGRGKTEELAAIVKELGADTVVADAELAPSQRRALEDAVKVKVIDRTAVILDIFSQHAKSREGKAQVELAQLEYLLPRLRGWGESMSRQAGGQVGGQGAGMGSRGPGETKIELDRRRIRTKMAKLRTQIKGFAPARATKRANRERTGIPSVAIAGYTNAGKSSLLNRITHAGVLVENALFATLDPTVRKTVTPDGRPYTLADTVGFVRNLPHQLVEAFRSTFEEVTMSDVVVHVVDASHPDPAAQIQTVRDVLGEVDARHIPEIVVFNKSDLITDDQRIVLRGLEPHALFVSAYTGEGIPELDDAIASMIPQPDVELTLVIPYDHGELVSQLHDQAQVLDTDYIESGTRIHVRVKPELAAKMERFIEA